MKIQFHRLAYTALLIVGLAGVGVWLFIAKLPFLALASQDRGDRLALAELQAAEKQAEVCSSRNAAGVGLSGDYFSEIGFRGSPLTSRIDPTIDFDSSFDFPSQSGLKRVRSVRWRGWVKPPISGRYYFHAGDAEAKISVSNQQIVGKDSQQDGFVELAAGRFYPVLLEVGNVQDVAAGRIKFEWTAPHGMKFVIPRALLFPPSESVSTVTKQKN